MKRQRNYAGSRSPLSAKVLPAFQADSESSLTIDTNYGRTVPF